MGEIRESMARCFRWIRRTKGRITVTNRDSPWVAIVPLEKEDTLISEMEPLDERELPWPDEFAAARERYPALSRRLMGAFCLLDEVFAHEVVGYAEHQLEEQTRKGVPSPEQLQIPRATIRVVEQLEEEDHERAVDSAVQEGKAVRFPKTFNSKKSSQSSQGSASVPQGQRLACECGQMGALVGRDRVKIHREYDDPESWEGEPWEQRVLRCRCGWEVTLTRRGSGYKIEIKKERVERSKLRRLLTEDLAEVAR